MLVVGGLLALAFQWRTLGRTFASIFTSFGGKRNAAKGPLDHIEIPMTWFVVGFVVTGILAAVLLIWFFAIHWWMGAIAVVMTFFLAAVAARAGAEIGINPIGALGKVTQLTYGALAPGNIPANLMTAGVTAGAACSCSDTVGNLKVGHMVGANPRRQFIAQLFGVAGRRAAGRAGVLPPGAGRQRPGRRQVPGALRAGVDRGGEGALQGPQHAAAQRRVGDGRRLRGGRDHRGRRQRLPQGQALHAFAGRAGHRADHPRVHQVSPCSWAR